GAAFGLLPAPAQAWNSIGHLTVAKLAYDQLDPAQQLQLYKMLQSHPHIEKFLAASRPKQIQEQTEWVVLRAAIWPDWVRTRDKGKHKDPRGPEVTQYHRGEEHYINVPFIDPNDSAAFAGKTLVDPDLTNCICALKQRWNDLKLSNASEADKA